MATIKDIADRAGVSVGTVDRIIHNRGRFSADTAERVRRIMDELDYSPNLMARSLSRTTSCRIGAFLPDAEQDSGYWALPLAGIRRAEADLRPFGLDLDLIQFDRYDPQSFAAAGERLRDGGYDGILMAPLRDGQSRSIVASLDPDCPVVYFDTDLPGERRLAYIGQDSLQSGRLAARLMRLLAAGSEGTEFAVILAPEVSNSHLDDRISGFRDSVDDPTDIIRVAVESDHDLEAFDRTLDGRIDEGVCGLFVVDASAHFAAAYLDRRFGAGARRIPVIGYDLVPENRDWMEAGVIDVLLTQRPDEQGYDGVNRLFRRIFMDEAGAPTQHTPIDIVMRENLKYILPKAKDEP